MRRVAGVACTALAVVGLATACGRERPSSTPDPMVLDSAPPTTRGLPGSSRPPPAAFPTGVYIRTIAAPPAELPQLEGTWRLLLNPDGTFELNGRFATRGRYTVTAGRVTFEHDELCPDGTAGVYGWSAPDGSTLRFEAVDEPCGPSREYHLAAGPWTRDTGMGDR